MLSQNAEWECAIVMALQNRNDSMVDIHAILKKIDNLRMGKRHGQYAPHKPLLILYALGELSRGREAVLFRDLVAPLMSLLEDFGPQRASHHPEYPFWRLQNDSLWMVTSDDPVLTRKSNNDAKKSELIRKNAVGSFLPEDLKVLKSDEENIRILVMKILDSHFPETLHREILDAIGMDIDKAGSKQRRSPDFRKEVLRAYEGRCCVCGYDLRLGNRLAGVEAAHIMWHTVGGPDKVSNGLALCVLHHKAFDLGAFTVKSRDLTVICSQELSGTTNRDWLIGYHGSRISEPQSLSYFPGERYLNWHQRTIFKGPAREQG